MYFVNSTIFCHLNIETCSAGTPVDFYVTGIIPRNPKKAAKLKPTDFRVNFLLFMVFGPVDSTIWWTFNWITQWCFFWYCVNVVKINFFKNLFSPNFVRLKQIAQSIRNFTHCFIFDSLIVTVLFYDKQFGEETKVLWTATAVQLHLLF